MIQNGLFFSFCYVLSLFHLNKQNSSQRKYTKYINYINYIFTAAIKAKEDAPVPPVGEMIVTVTIDRPEIIMIEDQARSSTQALMLDVRSCFIL